MIAWLASLPPFWRMAAVTGGVLVFATAALAVLSAVRPGAYLAERWARTRAGGLRAAGVVAAWDPGRRSSSSPS